MEGLGKSGRVMLGAEQDGREYEDLGVSSEKPSEMAEPS